MPRQELAEGEGLDEVVVGAGIETLDLVLDRVARGQHQDLGADPRARSSRQSSRPSREPASRRSRMIRSGGGGDELLERRVGVADRLDRVALLGQSFLQELRDLLLVLDDEDPHGSDLPARGARTAAPPARFMNDDDEGGSGARRRIPRRRRTPALRRDGHERRRRHQAASSTARPPRERPSRKVASWPGPRAFASRTAADVAGTGLGGCSISQNESPPRRGVKRARE